MSHDPRLSLEDCLGLADTPRLEDALKAYVSCSRVRKADDLLIVQPFHPALFMLGEQPGPTLLMSFQRGDLSPAELRAAWAREDARQQAKTSTSTTSTKATTTRPTGATSSAGQLGTPQAADIVMASEVEPDADPAQCPEGEPSLQQPAAGQPPRSRGAKESSPHALANVLFPCALCQAPVQLRAATLTEQVGAA
jgi:hypothetical protein